MGGMEKVGKDKTAANIAACIATTVNYDCKFFVASSQGSARDENVVEKTRNLRT
jgi:hypothetical protein